MPLCYPDQYWPILPCLSLIIVGFCAFTEFLAYFCIYEFTCLRHILFPCLDDLKSLLTAFPLFSGLVSPT